MSRDLIPFHSDDVSALARALKGELAKFPQLPSHVEMLNALARAAGYGNFQQMRAQWAARERVENPVPTVPAPAVDYVKVERLARYFDAEGRLVRWPAKHSERMTCLWVLWSRFTARKILSEAEVGRTLEAWHLFGDHALLRRELCDHGMMARTDDGREYRRIEQAPPPEALALIRTLAARAAA
ncbi:MAG: DUF2087 domain-containing protein [Xanthobacteraceae bacterium]